MGVRQDNLERIDGIQIQGATHAVWAANGTLREPKHGNFLPLLSQQVVILEDCESITQNQLSILIVRCGSDTDDHSQHVAH